MTVTIYDRVQETTTTSGTGAITLNGAIAGFVSFNDSVGVGPTTYYGIVDNTANIWEIGLGILSETNVLQRSSVLASSNSGSHISLVGNSTLVFIDVPASKRIQVDSSVIGTDSASVFHGDGSYLTGIKPALPIQTSDDPQTLIENAASNIIFQTDNNGNPQLLNVAGVHVFNVDGNGNPQIFCGNAPGFDGAFIGFDGNNLPTMQGSGRNIFAVDVDSGNPKINENIWPSNASGALTNDGSGNLSWSASAPVFRTVNAQTGTTYTIVPANAGTMITFSNTGAITVTISADSDTSFPAFSEIDIVQLNTGQITIVGAEGVSVNSYVDNLHIAGQYAGGTLKQLASNTWILLGNLA